MPEKGTTIAQAYVQIMPSMEGIQGRLESAMGGPLDRAGKSAGSRLGGALAGAMKTAALAGTAALTAAGGGVAALTKKAVSEFSEYQQLAGGIATLFEDLSYDVEKNANQAFQTAGLSANQYMDTVMSFAASLNQSLTATEGNIRHSAEYADQTIIDMADNANKMGSSMESIQNAYQGFAKQNYSMLDNLKLGYGGTQEEMFRLMTDAAALNDEFAKTAEFSLDASGHLTAGFADVVKAIHIVQTEMGITGTTAKEAADTVAGSLGMLKGAWENLVTGMANPDADLDQLTSNVVDSAAVAAENLLPVIEHALTGIGSLVEKLAPIVAEKLPQLVQEILPPILRAAGQLVAGIAAALPTLVQALADAMPDILTQLGRALMDAAPKLADAATHMLRRLADFLVEAMPQIAAAIPVIIKGIVKFIIANLPALLEAAMAIVGALAMGLIELAADLLKAGAELVAKVGEGIKNAARRALQWGRDLISNFIQGIKDKLADLWNTVKDIGSGIADFLGFSEPRLGPLSNFHTFAPDMMELFAQGIRDNAHLLPEAIESSFDLAPVIQASTDTGALRAPQEGQATAGGELAGILALLARYLPQTANSELLLDGDALVGGTLDRTDSALGQIEIRRRREGYAPAG